MNEKNSRGKVALCLGGGGITGAMYEVGVLAAVEDAIEDFRTSDFDLYIGIGSGAPLASILAGGVSALRAYRALLDPADDFLPLSRAELLQIDTPEVKRMGKSALLALRRTIASIVTGRVGANFWGEIDRFYDSLPAGISSLDPFAEILAKMFRRRGISEDFRELPGRLLLIANDLDRGEPVVFGLGHRENVSVTRAIAGASASPGLYAPVTIDGRDYIASSPLEGRHLELAVNEGATAILAINALVPVTAEGCSIPTGHGPGERVRDKGLLWVLNQQERIATQATLRLIADSLRAQRSADIHLIEPDRRDALMFMRPSMDFAARRVILKEGYTAGRRLLSDADSSLRRALEAKREALKTEG